MPQTKNFKFPLMADTPPEGATGKDLRDMILGESEDSLASMVDAELGKVKSSVLPVKQNGVTLTWDGNTSGLVKANGQLVFATNPPTVYTFYKISDEVIMDDLYMDSGKSKYACQKIKDDVYGFGVSNMLWLAFCVLSDNQTITENYAAYKGTLTFPKKGFYVYSVVDGDFCSEVVVKDKYIPYNPATMGILASEVTANKVQEVDEDSTHDQYPTAKAVWDALPKNGGGGSGITGIKVNGEDLEVENGEVDIPVPTKLGQLLNDKGYLTGANLTAYERSNNKVNYMGDIFSGSNINSANYPSTQAVYNFVKYSLDEVLNDALSSLTPIANWNGDTTDRFNVLNQYYKVSDSTETPDKIHLKVSGKDASGTILHDSGTVILDVNAAFSWILGLYMYGNEVIVAKRSGEIPAEFIEQMTGTNPGANIPYEAGTYFMGSELQGDDWGGLVYMFVSKASKVDGINNIAETIVDWDGHTEGLSNVLEMFWKVTDSTYVPEKITYRYANKGADGTVTVDDNYIETDGIMTDLADTFGIYVPTLNGQPDGIIICKRSGTLPGAIASMMLGEEIPFDIPYEAGTYVSNIPIGDGESRFLTKAYYSMSMKEYIDKKFAALEAIIK